MDRPNEDKDRRLFGDSMESMFPTGGKSRKEAEKRAKQINISDEEQLAEPQPQPQPQPELQPKGAENEQMKESRTEHPEGARAEQQQQKEEEPLEPLDQSILDILDED